MKNRGHLNYSIKRTNILRKDKLLTHKSKMISSLSRKRN
ncbi:hypothetical protein DDD_3252 [Nonlabens dokdonensis DSW-6]|uniref:Uncharacterized protein n=1 Tax=Nonlabens dokdonensis (strain DSM 17205 / KCTC 12402 / DSW-6) TaxID=592029 RepID=L7WE59_NONDD|nr:hypothetical protein DDD_3252 [Nonlabens dokdonensis DSW-6]